MKILFVIRTMMMGGAGKQLALTAKALCDGGHEVGIYTYMGYTLEHELDSRITYYPAERPPKNKFDEHVLSVFRLHKVIKDLNTDIIISWRSNAGFIARLASLGTNAKVIFSERTDPYTETNRMLKIATKVCDSSDGGVFQTPEAKGYFKRLDKKSVVIPNIVENLNTDEPITPISERRKEIAWVGRFFNQQKRIDIALKAMKIIHTKFPEYKLSIYGDGVDLDNVARWIEEFGLSDCVILKGATKNIIQHINKSRLLMFSSDYEGIPNVILEAFVAGTPVAATNCSPGGAKLIIDDNQNGFLVPIQNYKALAQRCITLIENDELSTNFIKSAREKLRVFDYDKTCKSWNDYIYQFKG